VNAVLEFGLVAVGDDAAVGEGEAAATGDDPPPPPMTGVLDIPPFVPPPPPHAASRDVVMSNVANLRNIAILIVKSAGTSVAQP